MAALLNSAYLYVGSDKYASVAAWANGTVYAAGALVRQLATPAVNSERVFVCIVAGTSGGSEPSWTLTKGAKTTDNTVTWQECTGQPPVNGDVTNTLAWTGSAKSNTVVLGQIIKNDAAANYQICTTAGTCGSGAQPSFSSTAGTTTADNTVTWTSLGVVGNFSAFAAPHARILNADASTWQTVVGSTIYISNGHAETQATTNSLAGGQGTASAPNSYLCVSNAAAPPTATTTGASVSVTGASTLNVGSNKTSYWEGIAFNAGSAANAAFLNFGSANGTTILKNCSATLLTTDTSNNTSIVFAGGSVDGVQFYNGTIVFGATGQRFNGNNNVISCGGTMIGGSIAASGSVPTILLAPRISKPAVLLIRDVDLSAITGTLATVVDWTYGQILLANCKLGAGVAMTTGAWASKSPVFRLHNCDDGTKNYRFYEATINGSIIQDTTVYNNAGATDGTTHISWAATTASTASFYNPYQVYTPISVWNETTSGTLTATVEIAGANTLTNAQIWMQVEYLGSSASPIGSNATNQAADIFATPTNITSSAASWTGAPAVTQKLQVSFAPRMKGLVTVRIFVARASTTVYIDPLITLS